jgi:hypothetical protein
MGARRAEDEMSLSRTRMTQARDEVDHEYDLDSVDGDEIEDESETGSVVVGADLNATASNEDHASFTFRHGLQDADPKVVATLLKVGIVAFGGALLWAVHRWRRKPRVNAEAAWSWQTGERIPSVSMGDLARPLLGVSIVVAEKCALLLSHAVHRTLRRIKGFVGEFLWLNFHNYY